MTSIHSNSGSMTALHLLGGTVEAKEQVQEEVSSGQEINSAKDNAALWAISQLMESDVSGYAAVSDSLSLDEATVAVAAVGAERATEILTEMKQLAIIASNGSVAFDKFETQLAHKTDELNSVISSTQFNGVNLLKTDIDGTGSASLAVTETLTRQGSNPASLSSFAVDSLNFENSADFDINNRTEVTDDVSALAALGEIEGFLRYAVEGSAALGAASQRISDQNRFISKMSDTVEMGISKMRDTNIEDAAARLKALSVQEQLGMVSLSIANASPQTLLTLS